MSTKGLVTINRLTEELAKARRRLEEAEVGHRVAVENVKAVERTLYVLDESEYWKRGC